MGCWGFNFGLASSGFIDIPLFCVLPSSFCGNRDANLPKMMEFGRKVTMTFLLISLISEMGHAAFNTTCRDDELEALNDFKNSFHAESYEAFASWKGSYCCRWAGIGCRNGRIRKLNLGRLGLLPVSDTFLDPLVRLTDLEFLDLSFNNFSYLSISPRIGESTRLKHLDLSWTGLSGEIPLELGKLSRLKYLSLARDVFQFNSSSLRVINIAWIETLSELRHLSLNGVDLREVSRFWALSLSKLNKLQHLALAGCRLQGKIPILIGFQGLKFLDLSFNTFKEQEFPEWIQEMMSLVGLNLSGCALRGPLPDHLPLLQELSLDRNYYLSSNVALLSSFSQIKRLSLSSCNISGSFQCSGILGLSFLFHLDLSSNQISGPIPACAGQLKKLQFLDLSFNNLTGGIPTSLSNLTSLTHLDLRHNQLNGTLPASFREMGYLRYLGLGNNMLSGNVPEKMQLPSELTTLDVSFNNFSGSVDLDIFQNLTNLKILHLSYSGVTIKNMNCSPSFSLEQLSVSSCNFHGPIPQWLSSQEEMVYLDLSNNMIQGIIPFWLWDLPSLAQLNISHNQLTGELPTYVHLESHSSPKVVDLHNNMLQGPLPLNFGSMEVLDLSNNSFSGTISPTVFGHHWNINFLSLSRNNLTGEIPLTISGSRSLEILDLSSNHLSGDLHGRFVNCSSLVVLNIQHNFFSGQLPQELGSMAKLQSLHMSHNRISGPLPSSLQNCGALEIMELDHNNISGTIPGWIGLLNRLRILILNTNSLEGSIPKEIGMATNIQILDLSNNKISGFIPPEIGNFKGMVAKLQPQGPFILRYVIGFGMTMSPYRADAEDGLGLFYGAGMEVMSKGQDMHFDQIPSIVTSMDLSNNNFHGHIPAEIGQLTGLVTLNLSRNILSGSIPKSVDTMRELESLDLSWNNLTGEIPSQLASLDFLQYLNLSMNSLCGEIPQGRHFETMDASSFLGNPNLCGTQINKTCGKADSQNASVVDDTEEDSLETLWWLIGIGLSYGLGFSTVITLVVIAKRIRNPLFQIFDNAIEKLHNACIG